MKKVCVFDVNETLLDLGALDPEFEKIFGDAVVRREWFGQFIQSAFVSVITKTYKPFGSIGAAALDMVADRHGVAVSDDHKKALLGKIVQLPPHPEVAESLARLKQHGYTLVALTNSTAEVAQKQLEHAGIAHFFDKVLSADAIKTLKPAKEVYEMAAQACGTGVEDMRLIAAHAWDIAGALRAGCSAAFIARPGMVLDPLYEQPEIIGKNLSEVVDRIIEVDV